MNGSVSHPSSEAAALFSAVLRSIAARRLRPEDAEDFVQAMELRMLERNYDVLTRFDQRSSLRTYLHVVIGRLLLDWRNASLGKWRPSTAARRFGTMGVLLDRLTSRDGYRLDDAIEIVRARWPQVSALSLRELARRLPPHPPRRFSSRELHEDTAVTEFEDPLQCRETAEADRRRQRAVARAWRALSPGDRAILRARYLEGRSVRAIAERAGTDPKMLYRRFDRVLRSLRRTVADETPLVHESLGGAAVSRERLVHTC